MEWLVYASSSSSAFASFRSLRVEALDEPVVDGLEERAGLVVSFLVGEQTGQARGGGSLPGLRFLGC